ncbi:MAG TPA: DUF742 domain-containing protein [Streptosporangiaceae bacterium]|nr:DUF742 domain-containing protein [Streptosporangiaceae bacterium]
MTGALLRSARVRPYAITGGRTRARLPLLLETLVSVPDYDIAVYQTLMAESREIYSLCRGVRSVAEISAGLDIPLGVVRVLISDLADEGWIHIHPSAAGAGVPEHVLLERVLRGLQTIKH